MRINRRKTEEERKKEHEAKYGKGSKLPKRKHKNLRRRV